MLIFTIKLPVIKVNDCKRALKHFGWVEARTNGGHTTLKHPQITEIITLPRHNKKDVTPGLMSRIIKNANVTIEQFNRALNGK